MIRADGVGWKEKAAVSGRRRARAAADLMVPDVRFEIWELALIESDASGPPVGRFASS